jgi:hypothetical protein
MERIFEEDLHEWTQERGNYKLTKIEKNTFLIGDRHYGVFSCDLHYSVISKNDDIIYYTSVVHFKQSWFEGQLGDCDEMSNGTALRFSDNFQLDPKLELPVLTFIHLEDNKVINHEYIILWTKQEQQKIIRQYFAICGWISYLLCIVFDYSIGPCLS